MADRLVVKESLVQDATTGAREAKNYLDSAQGFAEGLAEAVGKAGRLNSVIEGQESDWEIARGKMAESLGKLADVVQQCDDEFKRLDEKIKGDLNKSVEDAQGKRSAGKGGDKQQAAGAGNPGTGSPDPAAGGETCPPASGGGGSATGGGSAAGGASIPPLSGGGSSVGGDGGGFGGGGSAGGGGASVPPLESSGGASGGGAHGGGVDVPPLSSSGTDLSSSSGGTGTDHPSSPGAGGSEVPSLQGADGSELPDSQGTDRDDGAQLGIHGLPETGTSPERDRQLGSLIRTFAERWAKLTGRPVGEVLSVIGGMIGTGALASLSGTMKEGILGQVGTGDNSLTDPLHSGSALEGSGSLGDLQGLEGALPSSQDDMLGMGEGLKGLDDGESTSLADIADVKAPEELTDSNLQEAVADLQDPAGDLGGATGAGGGDAPDLPPLTSSGGGGGGVEPLPSLETASQASTPAEPSGTDLPSLETASEPTASSAPQQDLPDLEEKPQGSPARAGVPLMMGGMAAAMGAAASASRSEGEPSLDVLGERQAIREEAAEVLRNDAVADDGGEE